MLFHSKDGNLFEILQSGGGPDYKSFTIEAWNKKSNKWVKSGIYFKDYEDLTTEQLIELSKEKVESSIYA